MTTISRLFLVLCLLVSGASLIFAGVSDDDDIEFAMQNPFLRDLFRDRELRIAFGPFDRPSRRVSIPPINDDRDDFMLEMRIDQMVRVFLRRLVAEKHDLRAAIGSTCKVATEFRDAPAEESAAAATRLRQSLKDLASRAQDLRSTLASVISDLPEKTDYSPEIDGNAKRERFQSQVEFLEEQTQNAWQQINNFFFRPGATVSVAELKGDDMMISLHKIQLMADALAEAIP